MPLEFRNVYSNKIWIALVYGDNACGPTTFRKQGWWGVDRGQTLNVWNVNLQKVNRFASFYAQEFKDSGGATWNGQGNRFYRIRNVGFNQCYDDDRECNQQPNFVPLDFKTADNGQGPFYGLRVTLGPAPGQIGIIGSVLID
jgi:uncharacterized membrane protein